MKTEQEQIKKMARSMCGYCSTDGKCAVSKNGREPDICANVDTEHCLYKEYAERLIESGYGKVSEYKAEIERLRTTLGQCNTELNSALGSMKSQCREIGELKSKVKQAQIEILNKANERLNVVSREFGDDCDLCGVSAVCSCRCKINQLIKEVQNAEDKG